MIFPPIQRSIIKIIVNQEKEKEKAHIYYQISFNQIRNGSKSLCDFFCFQSFQKNSMIKKNTDEDTHPIHEYRELFVNIGGGKSPCVCFFLYIKNKISLN